MTTDWPSLKRGEFQVPDSDEFLWRVIGPHALDAHKKPTQFMFSLSSTDEGCLSISRGSQTTPQKAVQHREQTKGKKQFGAWAVSVTEVSAIGLRAVDDSFLIPPTGPPGHGYIDHRCGPSAPCEIKNWQREVRLQLFMLAQHRASKGSEYLREN